MLNRVQVCGNLGRDPEVRTTNVGTSIVSFTVAVNTRWTDKSSGEVKQQTEWVPVTVMNDMLGRVAQERLRKGSLVYVEGAFRTRKWTDKTGAERYSTEVMVGAFDAKLICFTETAGAGSTGAAPPARAASAGRSASERELPYIPSDDMPF
jgi:single-strand DNA-binding protein